MVPAELEEGSCEASVGRARGDTWQMRFVARRREGPRVVRWPRLVARAGLVPVLARAERAGPVGLARSAPGVSRRLA